MATCPNCGANASGKFCSECGAAIKGAKCVQCQAELAPGAKFCHRCGTPTGAAAATRAAKTPPAPAAANAAPTRAASSIASMAPWAVAGIAFVALILLVATRRPAEDVGTATPQAPFAGGAGPMAGMPAGCASGPPADISTMTPDEAAQRLFNRVMTFEEAGRKDCIAAFAPMAVSAYQNLPSSTADTHYDLGRIYEVSGNLDSAKVQADLILATQPNNLLGLTLAMRVARDMGDTKAAAVYARKLKAAAPAERKKNLPGYEAHAQDITAALKEASQ
ncbi:MAG TPA: zinc ribbon domain-containing protein [Gemmatimonadaceae bacterium]|nr:zinc ribbon domain-containing protein [Gemmatimonadaceae bacterium]